MLQYVMFGAQAAGMVGDIWAQNTASKMRNRGQQLEESQLDLRLKQERIASSEQSLAGLEMLAETLATQRALASVRGGLPGAGSNLSIASKSISNFNKDEQARSLSLEFSEQNKKAQIAMGRITNAGLRAQSGAATFNKAFEMLPLNEWEAGLKKTQKPAPVEKIKPTSVRNKQTGILTG